MTILAIDCAAEFFSVSLSTADGIFTFEADAPARHSELLIDAVDSELKMAQIERECIDLFACMKGPGSFTGLRIAFAALKGFVFALGKKMISVPTLDCVAHPFSAFPGLCVSVLDAKQRRFFAAVYRGGERLTDFLDITPENLAAVIAEKSESGAGPALVLLAGNGALLAGEALAPFLKNTTVLLEGDFCRGRSRALLQHINEKGILSFKSEEMFSAPFYIRKSDAEIKNKKM
jgi:tRNA threonylcarbamoyladenosine biosynthesis protein TsaB